MCDKHIFNPSTQETEAKILTGTQRQVGVHSEYQAIHLPVHGHLP